MTMRRSEGYAVEDAAVPVGYQEYSPLDTSLIATTSASHRYNERCIEMRDKDLILM